MPSRGRSTSSWHRTAERFYPKKDDVAERKEAMVRFMTSYFPAAQKAVDCTG
ncbi:hypothetical protein ACH4M4_37805 [Streptomyces sp. NPDC017254]|uniref:hypothetical protein n=1 Tax=unclassified Streptomyces TaxID=2593676 RepID=UPI0037ABABC1